MKGGGGEEKEEDAMAVVVMVMYVCTRRGIKPVYFRIIIITITITTIFLSQCICLHSNAHMD